MKNPLLYDTESKQTTQWQAPHSLDTASALREWRNIAIHNKRSYSMTKLQEVFKSWEN